MIGPVLIFITYALLGVFLLLCLVTGLYYLASMVEEYPFVLARISRATSLGVIVIHILMLLFEPFPFHLVLLGLASHSAYMVLLRSFPYIHLTDPVFLAAAALAIIQHSCWFYFFTQKMPPFNLIVSIFVVCVWLLPFLFFISLSTNEPPVLPGFMQLSPNEQLMRLPDDVDSISDSRKRKTINRLLWVIDLGRSVAKKYLPKFFPSSNTDKLV